MPAGRGGGVRQDVTPGAPCGEGLDPLGEPGGQPVPQGGDPRHRLCSLGRGEAQRDGQPHRPDHVLGAAAPRALLPPPC